ncbi:MAG: BtrH N-terminal domain-containing protein [Tannerella sp.]|jgi:hypothetical protein|nr:BtrH N-terminal domain-containing protein [Tannerella sp.]
MILNYEHQSAAHCETGVSAGMLNYYGITMSEPLVLGIGAGIFFSYMPFLPLNGGMPIFTFRTTPGNIFARVMKHLHAQTGRKTFRDEDRAMREMDSLLEQGIPVGNVIGVFYLPYFPKEYRAHFNVHNICVIGKEGDEYTVSDPIPPVVQTISYNDLKRVRFSKGSFPTRGKMYWIKKLPSSIPDLRPSIISGIRSTCRMMLDIPMPYCGVRGIRLLSKRMPRWESKYGEKGARIYLAQMIRMLEEYGTGGAGFRYMYAAFLHDAADIMKRDELKDFARRMNDIGDLWRAYALECGRKFKKRTDATYSDLAKRLAVIADEEKRFFKALRRFTKSVKFEFTD